MRDPKNVTHNAILTAEGSESSYLQRRVSQALKETGRSRAHHDRLIQRATGKSGQPLYDIISGKTRDPRTSTLRQVAAALGKPLSFFLPSDDQQPATLRICDPRPVRVVGNLMSFEAWDEGGECELWLTIDLWKRLLSQSGTADPATRQDDALRTLEAMASGLPPNLCRNGIRTVLVDPVKPAN